MTVFRQQHCPNRPPQEHNLQRQRGFTLVELLVVVAILTALTLMALAAFGDIKRKVYSARAMEELRAIEKVIAGYSLESGTLPTSLAQLNQGEFLDPWRNPYVYVRLSDGGPPRKDLAVVSINTDYDLYSKGGDGLTAQLLSNPKSFDDIIRGADGAFMGLGASY
ncbi:type II secretion system protein [Geomonas anaerohicana]|uniref:Type II secretion system protein n=1 Tax=Geomonas anaerohicana TaxID=2798583 RepID=A0ABS0YD17_9BACT|nr:type II secretion system protein [Geomonas anaerohicana]MBJ6750208.1 type II secretion system protein [Geomonas anaerohicana]